MKEEGKNTEENQGAHGQILYLKAKRKSIDMMRIESQMNKVLSLQEKKLINLKEPVNLISKSQIMFKHKLLSKRMQKWKMWFLQ